MNGLISFDPTKRLEVGPVPAERLRRAGKNEVRLRLQQIRSVLAYYDVTDLGALGELRLAGVVTPAPGLVRPSTGLHRRPTAVSGFRPRPNVDGLVAFGAGGQIVTAEPLPGPLRARPRVRRRRSVDLDVAYWAASRIRLSAGTVVSLVYPHHALVIIADEIVVEDDVTLTWQRPAQGEPAVPATPVAPAEPAAATSTAKPPRGVPGGDGIAGGSGAIGFDAPSIEMWTLDLTGHPVIDLAGQPGGLGGRGGAGGPGGPGAQGSREERVSFFGIEWCEGGPGDGGDGGRGGRGGDGGPGGPGGNGGRFSLFAPQPMMTAFQQSVAIALNGGAGGHGGAPGRSGDGGQGGQVGASPNNCDSDVQRTSGSAGSSGPEGRTGPTGPVGDLGLLSMRAITQEEFRQELTKPAILTLSKRAAVEGAQVSVNGLRFTDDDRVRVDGVLATTTVLGDRLLSFVVPVVSGGIRPVVVERPDGTASNAATLYVRPVLADVVDRAEPGQLVTVTGSGFAAGAAVLLDGEDMPDVTVLGSHSLRFRVRRPESVAPDPDGERVSLAVELGDRGPDSRSAARPLRLRTFRMLVLGDSVAWGQGLLDAEKFWSRTAELVRSRDGGIGVYPMVRAHSGAMIGLDNDVVAAPLDGEIPALLPSILQQVSEVEDLTAEQRADIRLVLLTGGINDVDPRRVLLMETAQLVEETNQHCGDDMAVLLGRVAEVCTAARIVVAGYFPILSDDSETTLIETVLIGLGALTNSAGNAVFMTEAVKQRAIENSQVFATTSRTALSDAVGVANAELPTPRIVFADPEFGAANAVFASDPLLFGLEPDASAQDPVAGRREVVCRVAPADRTDGFICIRASIGHPNPAGAARYADAIAAVLDV